MRSRVFDKKVAEATETLLCGRFCQAVHSLASSPGVVAESQIYGYLHPLRGAKLFSFFSASHRPTACHTRGPSILLQCCRLMGAPFGQQRTKERRSSFRSLLLPAPKPLVPQSWHNLARASRDGRSFATGGHYMVDATNATRWLGSRPIFHIQIDRKLKRPPNRSKKQNSYTKSSWTPFGPLYLGTTSKSVSVHPAPSPWAASPPRWPEASPQRIGRSARKRRVRSKGHHYMEQGSYERGSWPDQNRKFFAFASEDPGRYETKLGGLCQTKTSETTALL